MQPIRTTSQKAPRNQPGKSSPKDSQLGIEALTVEEIARSGKFSLAHVRNLIANGEIPSFTVGRCRRVMLVDYLAFVERLKHENKHGLPEGQK